MAVLHILCVKRATEALARPLNLNCQIQVAPSLTIDLKIQQRTTQENHCCGHNLVVCEAGGKETLGASHFPYLSSLLA